MWLAENRCIYQLGFFLLSGNSLFHIFSFCVGHEREGRNLVSLINFSLSFDISMFESLNSVSSAGTLVGRCICFSSASGVLSCNDSSHKLGQTGEP